MKCDICNKEYPQDMILTCSLGGFKMTLCHKDCAGFIMFQLQNSKWGINDFNAYKASFVSRVDPHDQGLQTIHQDLEWLTFQEWSDKGMRIIKGSRGTRMDGVIKFSSEQVTKPTPRYVSLQHSFDDCDGFGDQL